ncbi:MAG: ATP-binding domain-containing protein, partial [Calothrix sp. SM1_5_4]|nr:ATP-binding domain-containing protein [Calothrix sp. SM1_5_4]
RNGSQDVLAFIRSAVYPTEVSFRRIINLPARGIGEKTLEAIEAIEAPVDFHQKARIWAKSNPDEKASTAIHEVFVFLEDFKAKLVHNLKDAEEVLNEELVRIGYREHVVQSYRDPKAAEARWISVNILGRILDGFFKRSGRTMDTLERFIDNMELRDPINESDESADEVQMMTLHAAKGLEFPFVFLLGLEEDLLPHAKLGQDVDEERRLFYVGVTRAKKHLILTRVRQRKRYGRLQPVAPSRFLLELDKSLYTEHQEARPITAEERETLVADFLEKLRKKIDDRGPMKI